MMATNPTVAAWTKGNRQTGLKPPMRPGMPPASVRPGGSQGNLVVRRRNFAAPPVVARQATKKSNPSILDQLAAELGSRLGGLFTGTNQHTTGLGTGNVKVYPGSK